MLLFGIDDVQRMCNHRHMLWSAAISVCSMCSWQQAGETAEAATADFVQNLSQRISTALQPSLATIHRMVQAVVPVLQASASNRAAAMPQHDAGSTQAQRGAAAPQPSAQPPSAAPAAEVTRHHPASRPHSAASFALLKSRPTCSTGENGCRPWLRTVVHHQQQQQQLAMTVANSSGHTYQRPQCRRRSQWSQWTPQVRA